MRKVLVVAVGVLALSAIGTVVFAQRQQTNTALVRQRYLPEYTKYGDLVLPKNWRTWVYVGSPLTPDALNNGKAGFLHRTGILRDLQEDGRVSGGHDLLQGTAAGPQARAIPRRFAHGTLRPGLFPWRIQRRRRDRQGYQAVRADRQQLGLLQLQSSRAEGSDRQGKAKGRMRL